MIILGLYCQWGLIIRFLVFSSAALKRSWLVFFILELVGFSLLFYLSVKERLAYYPPNFLGRGLIAGGILFNCSHLIFAGMLIKLGCFPYQKYVIELCRTFNLKKLFLVLVAPKLTLYLLVLPSLNQLHYWVISFFLVAHRVMLNLVKFKETILGLLVIMSRFWTLLINLGSIWLVYYIFRSALISLFNSVNYAVWLILGLPPSPLFVLKILAFQAGDAPLVAGFLVAIFLGFPPSIKTQKLI